MEMANNMVGNNSSGSSNNTTYGNSYNNSTVDSGHSSQGGSGVAEGAGTGARLRDVCTILNAGATAYQIPTGGCAYDHIIALMRNLDLQDDGIVLNSKIKTIETDYCNIVRDESMLWYVFSPGSIRSVPSVRPLMINNIISSVYARCLFSRINTR